MHTYYYYLKLANQGKPGKQYGHVITASDPYEGLNMFLQHVKEHTRYLPIEDDCWYQEL